MDTIKLLDLGLIKELLNRFLLVIVLEVVNDISLYSCGHLCQFSHETLLTMLNNSWYVTISASVNFTQAITVVLPYFLERLDYHVDSPIFNKSGELLAIVVFIVSAKLLIKFVKNILEDNPAQSLLHDIGPIETVFAIGSVDASLGLDLGHLALLRVDPEHEISMLRQNSIKVLIIQRV